MTTFTPLEPGPSVAYDNLFREPVYVDGRPYAEEDDDEDEDR